VDYGDVRLWVVGGKRLDADFARALEALSGAAVRLRFPGVPEVGAGEVEPPVAEQSLPLGQGTVTLAFSRAAIDRAERSVRVAFFAISLLALAGAALLGLLIARRITRPVEALSEGARRVSQGDWTGVEVEASGEVGALVDAFNTMTSELSGTTQRLVAAERIAAWQEIAKGLAHELKNPLTPIQMSLETLIAAHGGKSPLFEKMFDESAQAMLEEVERLRRTIDAFSRFARLPKPQRSRFAVDEWARQVLAIYAAPPEGIVLDCQLAPSLWVEADRDQLTQVLVNLVKNAEEAMPQGGRIQVRARPEGSQVWLEVEDQGPGIPPEQRARIFEPYFTTKASGTGLGLAICARIAAEHGGRLSVEPGSGRGACFRLALPRLAAADAVSP
jgi:nitrogen fixation/metabolism regulation signal transduction histidine kinase